MMVRLDVLNPVAQMALESKVEPAPRPGDLTGKTVGLYWNIKEGGDTVLDHTVKLLTEKYKSIRFKQLRGSGGMIVRSISDEEASSAAKECDAAIGSIGSCGSCTSWLIQSMVKLEKLGIPTVTFICPNFMNDAKASARAFGLSGLPIAEIAMPGTPVGENQIRQMVTDSFPQVIEGFSKPVSTVTPQQVLPTKMLTFESQDMIDAMAKMNQQFIDEGWSDGLPLIPPTPQAVERMIGGTSLSHKDVVATLEPGFGIATVEKIAVNAVMAGCKPEHLPVVITAVQCISDPRMILRNHLMSTAGQTPMILVNGPISKELNINSKSCALGPASISYTNTVIGRALRLVIMNIGHNYPGVSDMSNIGNPLKYSLCVAENEDESPWEPYHVERGFDKTSNTVTVVFVYGISSFQDARSRTAQELVECLSTAMTNGASLGTGMWLVGRRDDPRYGTDIAEHNILLLTPEHARIIAASGWSKSELQQRLYDRAKMPFKALIANKSSEAMMKAHPELSWLKNNPEFLLPIVETPDCYDVVVAGHGGACSYYLYGAGGPITRPIEC